MKMKIENKLMYGVMGSKNCYQAIKANTQIR